MQYAQDVDFGLRPSEYYGERLIPSILSGKLEAANMERSLNWPRIKGRLNAIIHLQETLDTEFLIARFRPNLVRIHCKIDAEYIIKNLHSGEVFFVFIDKGTGQRYYCKSAFERTTIDYLENQAVLTVLKKRKSHERHSDIIVSASELYGRRRSVKPGHPSGVSVSFSYIFKRRITCKYVFLASVEKFF